jgi:hypothetical protein
VIDEIAQINVRDGTSIGARIYRPDGAGLIRPARGCALPLVNNNLPASAQFLWRETGLDHRAVGRRAVRRPAGREALHVVGLAFRHRRGGLFCDLEAQRGAFAGASRVAALLQSAKAIAGAELATEGSSTISTQVGHRGCFGHRAPACLHARTVSAEMFGGVRTHVRELS